MFDQPKSRPTGGAQAWLSGVLTGLGVLLLLVGGVMAMPRLAPYVGSRLVVAPPTPTTPPTPTLPPDVTPESAPLLPVFEDEPPPLEAPIPEPTTVPATPRPPVTPTGRPPTRIVIPDIDLDAPVVVVELEVVNVGGVAQATWAVPDERAAGWHNTTAMLGAPGNTVLNGHNTTRGEVFRDLYQLPVGALITLYAGQTPYIYSVREVLILPEAGQPLEVRIANAQYIQPTADERITLVTCHPYGSLQNRLIVIAHPVEDAQPEGAIDVQ